MPINHLKKVSSKDFPKGPETISGTQKPYLNNQPVMWRQSGLEPNAGRTFSGRAREQSGQGKTNRTKLSDEQTRILPIPTKQTRLKYMQS